MHETWFQSLGQEDPLEKGTAAHCSILAWRIPWREDPGSYGLLSLGLQRVRHEWATNIFRFPSWCSGKESTHQRRRCRSLGFNLWVGKIPWRRKWQATPVFLPGKFHGLRSLGATVHTAAKSWTTLRDWAHKLTSQTFFPPVLYFPSSEAVPGTTFLRILPEIFCACTSWWEQPFFFLNTHMRIRSGHTE